MTHGCHPNAAPAAFRIGLWLVACGLLLVAVETENCARKERHDQRVVCFKYKPETSQQDIDSHLEGFCKLPEIVPGIASYRGDMCVPNANGDLPAYSSMHYLTFETTEDTRFFCGSGRVPSEGSMYLEITLSRQKKIHRSSTRPQKTRPSLRMTTMGDD
jgi:hypothetical protein